MTVVYEDGRPRIFKHPVSAARDYRKVNKATRRPLVRVVCIHRLHSPPEYLIQRRRRAFFGLFKYWQTLTERDPEDPAHFIPISYSQKEVAIKAAEYYAKERPLKVGSSSIKTVIKTIYER